MLEVALDPLGLALNAALRCPAVAFTSCSLVRAGARLVTACFKSALAISLGLSSGL
jgi:hypothetical protein